MSLLKLENVKQTTYLLVQWYLMCIIKFWNHLTNASPNYGNTGQLYRYSWNLYWLNSNIHSEHSELAIMIKILSDKKLTWIETFCLYVNFHTFMWTENCSDISFDLFCVELLGLENVSTQAKTGIFHVVVNFVFHINSKSVVLILS